MSEREFNRVIYKWVSPNEDIKNWGWVRMHDFSDLKEQLRKGTKSIAVHGCGFIGTSTAMFYAREGIRVVAYDINEKKIGQMAMGVCDVQNLEAWSHLRLATYIDSGLIRPTNTHSDTTTENVGVNFIAVPTEAGGKPLMSYLETTLRGLEDCKDHLIIIESTISPEWIDELGLGKMPNVVIAPRRDWFADPTHNLRNLTRIYCGSTPEATETGQEVLGTVCHSLRRASNMKIATLGGKCIENSIHHIIATYAQQLANAYPDLDIREALELASTHPRIGKYFPNLKVGGYCVELGSKYVLDAARDPSQLSLCQVACNQNNGNVHQALDKIEMVGKTVACLGVTYKNDLKVDTLAAIHDVVRLAKASNAKKILVHDPYYSDDELRLKFGATPMEYPAGLKEADVILVLTDHEMYYSTPRKVLSDNIKAHTVIFDTLGVWKAHAEWLRNHCKYRIYGGGK